MSRRRLLLAIPAVLCLAASHPEARAESAEYRRAEAQFLHLPARERHGLQLLMAAAGYWDTVSTDRYSRRLFEAVRYAQGLFGFRPDGVPGEALIERLHDRADPVLLAWDLKEVRHPTTGTPLWVPAGLRLEAKRTDTGLDFQNDDESLFITFNFLKSVSAREGSASLSRLLRAKGISVLSRSLSQDSYVLAGRNENARFHVRYHRVGGGIVGFGLIARHDAAFHPERLEVLMSDLFRGHFAQAGRPVPPAPIRRDAPRSEPPPVARLAPARPERTKAREAESGGTTGTGFFVSPEGHVLTNAHVVRGCASLSVSQGESRAASVRLLASDDDGDLALLKTDMRPGRVAHLRAGARLGESVAAFGFPLSGLLSSGGNFTLGNITALSGVGDDSRHFQISTPVQPGNSGGPLLDMKGNVVGVVVGKLNALKVASVTDDLAQNVNFAVKASVAAIFLETRDIPFPTGSAAPPPAAYDSADIADFAKLMSVYIECRK